MTEVGSDQWYDERWQDMDPDMRRRAADSIRGVLSEEDQELIRRKHAEHGHSWIHHLIEIPADELETYSRVLGDEGGVTFKTWSAHHGWGTGIRNLLRNEEYGAGISDDELPFAPYENGSYQNWDDYYCQAVEAAVGLRDV